MIYPNNSNPTDAQYIVYDMSPRWICLFFHRCTLHCHHGSQKENYEKGKNIKFVIKYPIKTKFMLVSSNYHLIM